MSSLKSSLKHRNGTVHYENGAAHSLSPMSNVDRDEEHKIHRTHYSPNKAYIHQSRLINHSISTSKTNILLVAVVISSLLIIQQFVPEVKEVIKLKTTTPLTSRRILDLNKLGYTSKPNQVNYYYNNGSFTYKRSIKYSKNQHKRKIKMTKTAIQNQKLLRDDDKYEDWRRDPFEEGDCVKQYDWQTSFFPNCNLLHEVEMMKSKLIANGYWRDVWRFKDLTDNSYHALKTIRWMHGHTSRNIERHRRDAVAMERLTSSKYVLDIYGYCGQSSIVMYSSQGDLDDLIWNSKKVEITSETMVKVATQVARGIGDVNYVVNLNRPAIAHTDISTGQFIYIDGVFRINDFNRCRFIRWNKKEDHACGYYVGNNPKKFRSPEEYYYKAQSEKVDVYSMGNIFYVLLTKEWPFDDMSDEDAQHEVKHGRPPPIPDTIRNSTDPYTQALIMATEMCWVYEPEKRPTARQVEAFLSKSLQKISQNKSIN